MASPTLPADDATTAPLPLDEMPPFTAWLSDMDGVLVRENRALPGAQQFLDALRQEMNVEEVDLKDEI